MKSSFHSLIPFLPLFCNCQFQRLDSIQFLCSQAHILAGWSHETRLFTLCCSVEFFFITTLHGPHGKRRLLLSHIVLGELTAPLYSNDRGADHIENSLSIVETRSPRARVYTFVASNGHTRHQTHVHRPIRVYRIYDYFTTYGSYTRMRFKQTNTLQIYE
jgi:hypothetical protein